MTIEEAWGRNRVIDVTSYSLATYIRNGKIKPARVDSIVRQP